MYVCAYLSVLVCAGVYLCVCVYARTRVSVCVFAHVCVRAGALEHLFSSGRGSSQQTVPVLPLRKNPALLVAGDCITRCTREVCIDSGGRSVPPCSVSDEEVSATGKQVAMTVMDICTRYPDRLKVEVKWERGGGGGAGVGY